MQNTVEGTYIRKECKDANIKTLKEAIQYFKERPTCITQGWITRNIPQETIERIIHPSNQEPSLPEDSLAIKINICRRPKDLRHRELFISRNELNEEPNEFIGIRYIKHPRERQTAYMIASKKLYTNEKLCRLKITDDPYCYKCPNKLETITHLTQECPRTIDCYNLLERICTESGVRMDRNKDTNIKSMVSHFIYINRNQNYDLNLLECRIRTRLKDLEFIKFLHAKPKGPTNI